MCFGIRISSSSHLGTLQIFPSDQISQRSQVSWVTRCHSMACHMFQNQKVGQGVSEWVSQWHCQEKREFCHFLCMFSQNKPHKIRYTKLFVEYLTIVCYFRLGTSWTITFPPKNYSSIFPPGGNITGRQRSLITFSSSSSITVAWVTRSERLKGAKDEGPHARSLAPEELLNFLFGHKYCPLHQKLHQMFFSAELEKYLHWC